MGEEGTLDNINLKVRRRMPSKLCAGTNEWGMERSIEDPQALPSAASLKGVRTNEKVETEFMEKVEN